MAGGITFGAAKSRLRLAVDGGVGISASSRVMDRVNEAQELILSKITPVNGMMSANIKAEQNGFFNLPPEMENAIDAVVLGPVNNQTDVIQFFYEIVNPFTYLDPSVAKDNPLIDHGLVPDPGPPSNPSVLLRRYEYPGVDKDTLIHVTGDKSFVPITSDDDYLIVQNIPALQIACESIALRWANAPEEQWQGRLNSAIQVLKEEVAKHMMDRRNFMRRRSNYETDLLTFAIGTKGWIRARIALEQPGAMLLGKSELDRLLDRSEMALMEMGTYKGMVSEIEATVYGGELSMPSFVETLLGVSMCGQPQDIRHILYNYSKTGPGNWDCSCGGYLRDLGEERDGSTWRRKYKVLGSCTTGQTLLAVFKYRWLPKKPGDQMVIRNLRAHRAMVDALIQEQNEKWDMAMAARSEAKRIMDEELNQYLDGIKTSVSFVDEARSFAGLGEVL